ncbi:MAG: DNA-binding response OmpR family regulator/anti-sigma regulatory factor (Ser/Thr protein kinase) [Oleispira sp.]|jgi:DNA-binding response OmpR family regulator/anti-sigma regulatory factor (Ser/Thr protein kinase)
MLVTKMKILIADDNASDRLLLSKIISKQGHEVIQVENGKHAIECYLKEAPDIILMDVMMPELDGKGAAKEIKRIAGEDLIPIIFLTSLIDAQSLADCLEAGGDDFLTKPYNPIILKAKIDAFVRMRKMHGTLQKQRDTIAANNQHMLQEQHVAKAVFDNVAHSGCLDAANIKYMLSPLAVFNGDVLLAARKPSGGMHVLLGDFTGHGLPAAIGAMPLAEIFYGMTAKGFGLRNILREINSKLKSILPVGFFCCAAVVDLSFTKRSISMWMGGVPDCYLLSEQGTKLKSIRSQHLPLGVLSSAQFDDEMTEHVMDFEDRLFMWSDGIVEARDGSGNMFGEERLQAVFNKGISPSLLFESVKQSVSAFVGDTERDDDTTIIELKMVDEGELEESALVLAHGAVTVPNDWKIDYELGVDSLKNINPLPLVMHIMMEVPALREMGGQLFTVVSELFSNALEHGILKLDSALKSTPAGFSEFYTLREQRLSELTSGFIKIKMSNVSEYGYSGTFSLSIEDSGEGFDHPEKFNQSKLQTNSLAQAQSKFSGRGIPLIDSLCHSLEYIGCGNKVIAEIHWPQKNTV